MDDAKTGGAELPLEGLLADLIGSWEEPAERELMAVTIEESDSPDFRMLAAALTIPMAPERAAAPASPVFDREPAPALWMAEAARPADGEHAAMAAWTHTELRVEPAAMLPAAELSLERETALPEPVLEPEEAQPELAEPGEEIDPRMVAEAAAQSAAARVQLDRFVAFECAGRLFGLALDQVSEVERVPHVTAVPGSPAVMCGLINRRGDIVPLIDLRLLLYGTPHDDPGSGRLVMTASRAGEEGLAYLVDGLAGLAALERAKFQKAAKERAESWGACLAGSGVHRGRELLILDPNALREETLRCFEI